MLTYIARNFSKGLLPAMKELKLLFANHPRSAIIPALTELQNHTGWISDDDVNELSNYFDVKEEEIFETVTFYSMFNREPVGDHIVQVCTGGPCSLRGSDAVLDKFHSLLDEKVTVRHVECLGACCCGPVITVDGKYHEAIDEEEAQAIANDILNGVVPKQRVCDKKPQRK
ncbi:hypothetical protein PCE1_002418 [Barthelona sp. PCE]